MHLLELQDNGEFSLVRFVGNSIPTYATLSHTWGPEDEEVTYQDVLRKAGKEKKGYYKLVFCGKQAARDGLRYFWIDTCCIDKTSSAELAEAITSMFYWYKRSSQCYVYLSDVSASKRKADYDDFSHTWESAFRTSRWFSRGWTLQELIAPRQVTFFSKEGDYLGDKLSLERVVHDITRIPVPVLRNNSLYDFDVEERMSWIEDRRTTREEDEAYSMLGIVGVSMLPMYGEGKERAFKRLRREIREASGDKFPSMNEEQRQRLLESLRFEQIDARQMTIKNAHAKTCKWLLKNQQYIDWLNVSKLGEHHGFLWIKGKAGAGKSTLMKFALINARKTMKDHIILSFFFNARGEDIEKSTIGAYRSLLLQLFERLPALQSTFDLLGLSASKLSAGHQWNIELLKMLLEQALQMLGEARVVCFIDALDECEEEPVRDMIQFLERIGDTAASGSTHFHVFFSSRHYPHITIRKGLELVLEDQQGHTQDIANYVETELKIGQSRTAKQIRVELQEKASGIFMWVVLVVSILNKEWDRGQVHMLRRKLEEIPGDLHELFRDIITRDSHNKDSLVLCIQWVLFAKQPLSPEQLYHAVLSGVDPDAVSAFNSEEITQDVLKRFILDCSKGLVETTMSKKQKIQFIHESVRDFLLKENGLSKVWPEFGSNFQGQSHEQLKRCCLEYVSSDAIASLNLPDSLPKASSKEAVDMRATTLQRFPLLEYAVWNVLYHADTAQESGCSQAQFLNSFPPPQWIKLDNLLEKHEVRRHSAHVSCLYLLAELNMANLIGILPSADQCMVVENERYGCALLAAAATGSEEALEACLRAVRVDQAGERRLHTKDEPDFQHVLAQRTTRREFVYSKAKGFWLNAAELGHDKVLTFLISLKEFDIDSKDSRDRTALWWASKNGCENALRLLLMAGSVMVSKDKGNKTPLYVAVENGNYAVAKTLLENGAEVNAQNGNYGNALQAALSGGFEQIVELLLDKGADANAQWKGGVYGNALQAASYNGYEHIVKLLLVKGADVNAKGGKYNNALQAASFSGNKRIVKLLVGEGAARPFKCINWDSGPE